MQIAHAHPDFFRASQAEALSFLPHPATTSTRLARSAQVAIVQFGFHSAYEKYPRKTKVFSLWSTVKDVRTGIKLDKEVFYVPELT